MKFVKNLNLSTNNSYLFVNHYLIHFQSFYFPKPYYIKMKTALYETRAYIQLWNNNRLQLRPNSNARTFKYSYRSETDNATIIHTHIPLHPTKFNDRYYNCAKCTEPPTTCTLHFCTPTQARVFFPLFSPRFGFLFFGFGRFPFSSPRPLRPEPIAVIVGVNAPGAYWRLFRGGWGNGQYGDVA